MQRKVKTEPFVSRLITGIYKEANEFDCRTCWSTNILEILGVDHVLLVQQNEQKNICLSGLFQNQGLSILIAFKIGKKGIFFFSSLVTKIGYS